MEENPKNISRRSFIERTGVAAAGLTLLPGSSSVKKSLRQSVFDIRNFGALGDGITNDTEAIVKAIDACSQNGGGTVLIDNGIFVCGTVMLKSHVELHLTSTAKLLGSTDMSLYYRDEKMPYKNINRAMIYAMDCTDVSITGQGIIDGSAAIVSQMLKEKYGEKWWGVAGGTFERTVLIRLRNCRNTRIEGVLLINSLSFSLHVIQCRQLCIDGIRIESVLMPNSDGIDVDGCREVFISNCNIHTEDDSIALKTTEHGSPCRDIVITNCIISSLCAAFRAGCDAVEDIENVTMSNCVIRDTLLNGIKIQESMGAVMRNMTFSNIIMDNVKGPVSIRLAGWKLDNDVWARFDDTNWAKGKLQNIHFENICASVPDNNICMSITGTAQTRPENITFSNIDITFSGGGTAEQGARRNVPDLERDYPEMYMFGDLPAYGLYVHHATGIVFNNVRFRLENADLRPAIVCVDVTDLELAGFKADGNKNAESLIRLENSQNVFIRGCRVLNEIGTYLLVEGPDSKDIMLSENKLNLAKKVTAGLEIL